MRTTLVANLEDQGYRMSEGANGREALDAIDQSLPDVVISDLRLPDLDGLDILHKLKDLNAETAFVLVTGYATVDTAVEALNEGAYAYIIKPFNMDQVHSVIRNAVLQQRLVRENRRLVSSLQSANLDLNNEVGSRKKAEEALQGSLERVEIGYRQATIYAEELRAEIEQRTRAESALERSEGLRRRQVAQEAKDQERKRLAEELHDETLAELTSVIVDLRLLSRTSRGIPPEVSESLSELRERVRTAEVGLRRIVQGLFPSVLTNLGLLPALRSYMEDVAARPAADTTPIEMGLKAIGLDRARLPEDVEIAIYRIAQQGIANTLQHANAGSLELELAWNGDELTLSIVDDGQGFDVDQLERTSSSVHFGLLNVKDRVDVLGGSLSVESGPSGTRLLARVPTETSAPDNAVEHRSVYVRGNRDSLESSIGARPRARSA